MSLDIQTLRLKLLLQEELSDNQKKEVDGWQNSKRENRNIDFSDNFFGGKDNMRRSFDLQTPEKISKHAKLIAKHFENHPHIRITDYGRGEASETVQTQMGPKERPISIAKALSKTGADHLVPGFANDPTRTSASKNLHKDYQVTITRHPHDIAGMTSSGQSWVNASCMNYENGINRGYLRHDVKHGTHVAYLHHKDDPEIKKPLARIALKPFHNMEDDKDTILRPEDRTYGSGGSHFNHTVHAILDRHFSGVPGSLYTKSQMVYDDSGDDNYFAANSKEDIDAGTQKLSSMKSEKYGYSDLSNFSKGLINHPQFNSDHMDSLVKNQDLHNHILHNTQSKLKLIKPHHLDEILSTAVKKNNTMVIANLASHPAATSKHLNDILDIGETKHQDHYSSYRRQITLRKTIPDDIFDRLVNTKDMNKLGENIHSITHNNSNLSDSHIHKVIDASSKMASSSSKEDTANQVTSNIEQMVLHNNKAITPEHIDKMLDIHKKYDSSNKSLPVFISNVPALHPRHVDYLMKASNNALDVYRGISENNPHMLSNEHIQDFIQRKPTGRAIDDYLTSQTLSNIVDAHNKGEIKLTPEHMTQLVKHSSSEKRKMAASIYDLPQEHLARLQKDRNKAVKLNAQRPRTMFDKRNGNKFVI